MLLLWLAMSDNMCICNRLRIYEGGELIIDTGRVYDWTLRGGKLGFFVLHQPQMIWSDLSYRCQGNPNFLKSKIQRYGLISIVLFRLVS